MGEDARDRAEAKIDEVRAVYDRHGRLFHVAWVVVSVVVVLVGIVMMVLPGPAAVVVPLGLAMLAVVFGWARRLLVSGVDLGADLLRVWHGWSTWAKVLAAGALLAAAGGIAAWLLL